VTRYRSEDPVEDGLLDAIRQAPTDADARSVYMDWLEQHGQTSRLAFLREERETDAPREDAAWRAVVSNPPIMLCPRPLPCGRRWTELTPTDDDAFRQCTLCKMPVLYYTEPARPPVVCVADASVAKQLEPLMHTPRPYGNPPPPQLPHAIMLPPKPGAFVRIKDWFRKR
jgi:uncharacterized protein (TIGR02996 family)